MDNAWAKDRISEVYELRFTVYGRFGLGLTVVYNLLTSVVRLQTPGFGLPASNF